MKVNLKKQSSETTLQQRFSRSVLISVLQPVTKYYHLMKSLKKYLLLLHLEVESKY